MDSRLQSTLIFTRQLLTRYGQLLLGLALHMEIPSYISSLSLLLMLYDSGIKVNLLS